MGEKSERRESIELAIQFEEHVVLIGNIKGTVTAATDKHFVNETCT